MTSTNMLTGSDDVAAPGRAYALENGFGDLIFGREIDREHKLFRARPASEVKADNNKKFVEPGDFVRTGTFHFLLLPEIVHERILGFLLEPLFSENSQISIMWGGEALMAPRGKNPKSWWNMDWHSYLEVPDDDDRSTLRLCYKELTPHMIKQVRWQRIRDTPHPNRNEDYLLRAVLNKTKGSLDKDDQESDYSMIHLLRQLFYVSTQVRFEVSRHVWQHAQLAFDLTLKDLELPNRRRKPLSFPIKFSQLETFFAERPLVRKCVRTLKITIRCELCDHNNPLNFFTEFFAYMGANMEPQNLEVVFWFENLNIFKIAVDSEQLVNALNPLKRMVVGRKFSLQVVLASRGPSRFGSMELEDLLDIKEEYRGRIKEIRELVMPDYLRDKVETEKEIYLHARSLLFSADSDEDDCEKKDDGDENGLGGNNEGDGDEA